MDKVYVFEIFYFLLYLLYFMNIYNKLEYKLILDHSLAVDGVLSEICYEIRHHYQV